MALLLLKRCEDKHTSQTALDAYMHGFRVRYAPPICVISQNTPTTMLRVADEKSGGIMRKRKWARDAGVYDDAEL